MRFSFIIADMTSELGTQRHHILKTLKSSFTFNDAFLKMYYVSLLGQITQIHMHLF